MADLSQPLFERQTDTKGRSAGAEAHRPSASFISFRGLLLLTSFILSIAIWVTVAMFIIRV